MDKCSPRLLQGGGQKSPHPFSVPVLLPLAFSIYCLMSFVNRLCNWRVKKITDRFLPRKNKVCVCRNICTLVYILLSYLRRFKVLIKFGMVNWLGNFYPPRAKIIGALVLWGTFVRDSTHSILLDINCRKGNVFESSEWDSGCQSMSTLEQTWSWSECTF